MNRISWVIFFILLSVAAAQMTGLSDELLDYVKQKYGRSARKRLIKWQELIEKYKNKPVKKKLKVVNNFFNDVRFVSDIKHWRKEDYWATPVEMLVTKGGDCEDFSIAKYFTLKEMGVPMERMLITYVKALDFRGCRWCKASQAHMVLTYYETPTSEPLVLDNLIDRIKPASKRKDLKPVYSFNGDGLWLSKQRGRGKRVGGSDRISLWKEMNKRFEKELSR